MSLQDATRFTVRIVATACIILWFLEETSTATRCPPTDYVGEVWELDRIGQPHDEVGADVLDEDATWQMSGMLENTSFGRLRAEALASGAIEMDGV